MPGTTLSTLRFARAWLAGGPRCDEREIALDRGDARVPASLLLPRGRVEGLPGWVVLHGITVPGRAHPALLRFARSLAASPAAVLVPEIPEWRELRLDAGTTVPTIRAAVLALDARPETVPGRTGVVGFSFGAPQAVVASTDPDLDGHLAGVAGFGGYCDLRRTFRFQFTGRHEWRGETYHQRPDPYGRWVVGSNYLTATPEHGDAGDVAEGLRALAREAGERRIQSWDPVYDSVKRRIREGVAPGRRPLFDLFAPPADEDPDPAAVEPMVQRLHEALLRVSPELDPLPGLHRIRVPVRLVHGKSDPLIPFSETLRLRDAFPPDVDVRATLTGLFAHSQESPLTSLVDRSWESVVFLKAVREVLGLV